jgi:hypothetical protein
MLFVAQPSLFRLIPITSFSSAGSFFNGIPGMLLNASTAKGSKEIRAQVICSKKANREHFLSHLSSYERQNDTLRHGDSSEIVEGQLVWDH